MRWCFLLGIFTSLFLLNGTQANGAQAETIQILHTNDIHSFFDYAWPNPRNGGYARLKTIIDREIKEAQSKGIPTILIDAGDFLEGNLYYMADRGEMSFKLHNAMGYQVVALGNHDYLMGASDFNDLLGRAKGQFNFPILAANIDFPRRFSHIREAIKSTHVLNVGHLKMCFIGVTSNEKYYSWALEEEGAVIHNPVNVAIREANKLERDRCHYTIALTHMSIKKDQELSHQSKTIDLIIGGHSKDLPESKGHDIIGLDNPIVNSDLANIPILKAGQWGNLLGKIHISIDPQTREHKIIQQEFIPVADVRRSSTLKTLVNQAKAQLAETYGVPFSYFQEHLGYLDVGPDDNPMSIWNSFIVEAMRDATDSDTAVNDSRIVAPFEYLKEGRYNLTRFDVRNTYPRFFQFKDKNGWKIYEVQIPGFLLKMLIKNAYSKGRPTLTFARLDFNVEINSNGKMAMKDITINGALIRNLHFYKVAVPEGIIKGIKGAIKSQSHFFHTNKLRGFFKDIGGHIRDFFKTDIKEHLISSLIPTGGPIADAVIREKLTDITIFQAMETLLKKRKVIDSCKFYPPIFQATEQRRHPPCRKDNQIYLMDKDEQSFSIRSKLLRNEYLTYGNEGSIDVHYYVVYFDDVGFTELALLREAAKHGVRVRMVIDTLEMRKFDRKDGLDNLIKGSRVRGMLKHLWKEGVKIRVHHDPVLALRKINVRNHNKILKFSHSAIIGDRNLKGEHYNYSTGKDNNFLGFDVIVKGSLLYTLENYLDQFWHSERLTERGFFNISEIYERWAELELDRVIKEDPMDIFSLSEREVTGFVRDLDREFISPDYMEWIFDRDHSSRQIKRQSLSSMDKIISAIYRAKTSVKIVGPYIILTARMRYALKYALEKGLHVEFVTNGLENSTGLIRKFVDYNYAYHRPEYCAMGIDIGEVLKESQWRIHAKVVIIDDETVFISSNNWDPRSERINTESGIRIDDTATAAHVLDWFERLPKTPASQSACPLSIHIIYSELLRFIL